MNRFNVAYGERVNSVVVDCSGDEVITEQSHLASTDINNILASYNRGQLVNYVNQNEARYDDIPPIDFQSAMLMVAQGNSLYEGLPAKVRQQFKSPMEFLTFVNDDKNKEAVYAMGLANKPKPVVDPAQPGAEIAPKGQDAP